MAFENPYLVDFAPIFFSVLKEKGVNPAKVELVIFDEEADEHHPFERAGVLDVLDQLSGDINALTICTDRPEHFFDFAESACEESGLLVVILPKRMQNSHMRQRLAGMTEVILDFEHRFL